MGTWFYLLDFDWMEADLNVRMEMTVRKGRGLNSLYDWRSPAHREKSVVSWEDRVMMFNSNTRVDESFRSITCI